MSWQPIREWVEIENSNPEGCNQHTGPGCSLITSSDEVNSKIVKAYEDDFVKSLTEDEVEAFQDYNQNSDKINSALRQGILGGYEERMVQELDNAYEKAYTPKSMTLYRGLSHYPDWEVGEIVQDLGYTSTSKSKNTAIDFAEEHGNSEGGAVITLRVPKDYPAVEMSSKLATSYSESEILLDRSAKMKIISIQEDDGKLYIEAEVIQRKTRQ